MRGEKQEETGMVFELHITVDSENFDKFEEVCKRLKISPLFIRNASGAYSKQMLCAFQGKYDDIEKAKTHMRSVSRSLGDSGFRVIREKIECPIGDSLYSGMYQECHIKLIVPKERTEEVLRFSAAHGISASWSLVHSSLRELKWYLTVRDYKSGPEEARVRFSGVVDAVQMALGKVKSVEMETALLDTNVSLDQGWA